MPTWDFTLVAVNETERVVRLGTCKRSADRLASHLVTFDGHIKRFIAANPKYQHFKLEKVAIAPMLDLEQRSAIESKGYIAQSLADLIAPLAPG